MAGQQVATRGNKAPAPKPNVDGAVVEFVPFMAKASIRLTVQIVKTMLCTPTRQGHICSDGQAMRFMMLCRARCLNPFEGDAYLVGFDTKNGPQFNLITAHQAFLKRAEVHPEFDGMESGVFVRSGDEYIERESDFVFDGEVLLAGWARVHFKNRKIPTYRRLKLSTFKKTFGRWEEDPAGMIVTRAEADALRSSFPTLLGGMYLDDELSAGGNLPADETSGRHSSVDGLLGAMHNVAPDPVAGSPQEGQEDPQQDDQDEPAQVPAVNPAKQQWRDETLESHKDALGGGGVCTMLEKQGFINLGQLYDKLATMEPKAVMNQTGLTGQQFKKVQEHLADIAQ